MKQVKVSELSGAALDYCVAQLEKRHGSYLTFFASQWHLNKSLRYSSEWVMGGPIIEREMISAEWHAGRLLWRSVPGVAGTVHYGETPLIAAMRCYVASKLGDVVEIPEELC